MEPPISLVSPWPAWNRIVANPKNMTPMKAANCFGGPGTNSSVRKHWKNIAAEPAIETLAPAAKRTMKSSVMANVTHHAHDSFRQTMMMMDRMTTMIAVPCTTHRLAMGGNKSSPGLRGAGRWSGILALNVGKSSRRCSLPVPAMAQESSHPPTYLPFTNTTGTVKCWFLGPHADSVLGFRATLCR